MFFFEWEYKKNKPASAKIFHIWYFSLGRFFNILSEFSLFEKCALWKMRVRDWLGAKNHSRMQNKVCIYLRVEKNKYYYKNKGVSLLFVGCSFVFLLWIGLFFEFGYALVLERQQLFEAGDFELQNFNRFMTGCAPRVHYLYSIPHRHVTSRRSKNE